MSMHCLIVGLALAVPLLLQADSPAHSDPCPPDSGLRTDEIDHARHSKAANLTEPEVSRLESILQRVDDGLLGGAPAGISLRMGGPVTGSGLAIGPRYVRRDLAQGALILDLSAAASTRRFYIVDSRLTLPYLASQRLALDFYARRADAPQMPYYGSGPRTDRLGRTNYRLEDTSFETTIATRPLGHSFSTGFSARLAAFNVGPGTDFRFASAPQVFVPQQAPGIDHQTSYLISGPYLQFDNRDQPGTPHRGGNYVVRYLLHRDIRRHNYSFQRLQTSFEHYIPFLNEKRVIALRARSELAGPQSGHQIPFYLQSTLGGPSFRGFRLFRFYGNNSVLFNTEYRWEIAPPMEMALFVDAGRVFDRPGHFQLGRMEKSYGFGFRFKTRDAVVLRVDTGFSREGFQLWLRFDQPLTDLFRPVF
jgi:hypothetical protein